MSETETRTRRAGLGASALIGSLVPAVWLLVLFAAAGSSTDSALADAMITASFVVLPFVGIAVLVLAVISFVVNNWLGRILAAVALALLIAQVVVLVIAATTITL